MKMSLQQHRIHCCTTCQINKNSTKMATYSKDDMPFFYISVLCPAGFFTACSVVFLGIAFIYLNNNNYNTGWKVDGTNYLHSYGKAYFTCIDSMPYEGGMWPSFLRQTQLNYWTNIYFRISVMGSMPLRIFFAFIVRSFKETENERSKNSSLCNFFNNLIPFVLIVEVLSQVIFSVITIRFDSASFYQYAFTVFFISSAVYMYLKIIFALATHNENKEYIDVISIIVKLIATVIYSYCLLNVFPTHLQFIKNIGCHAYVKKSQAIHEYILIISYLLFHLTQVIDFRKVRFLCYPPELPFEDFDEKNDIKLVEKN